MEQINFRIRETRQPDSVRLTVTGELDLASSPILEGHLEKLRGEGCFVRLDFSTLEFIDSSGIRLLFNAFRSASGDGWGLEIEPHVAPQAMRLFELVKLDQFIADEC